MCRLVRDLDPSGRIVSAEATRAAWSNDVLAEEAALIAGAAPEARAAFAAGRVCARAALGRLGAPTGPLLRRESGIRSVRRAPAWPEGFVGSLSHAGSHCAAVVAGVADAKGIGLDLEQTSRVTPKLLDRICTARERARAEQSGAERALHFSAKEAFYKLWSPMTSRPIGFRDVEVVVGGEGRLEVRIIGDVDPGPFGHEPIEGGWRLEEGLIAALVWHSAG